MVLVGRKGGKRGCDAVIGDSVSWLDSCCLSLNKALWSMGGHPSVCLPELSQLESWTA